MNQRMTTEWDYDKKDYVRVPDPAIERYVSVCSGRYLFDLKYMADRIMLHSRWPMMTDKGIVICRGNVVIEDEDLPRIIEVLQERLEVSKINQKGA